MVYPGTSIQEEAYFCKWHIRDVQEDDADGVSIAIITVAYTESYNSCRASKQIISFNNTSPLEKMSQPSTHAIHSSTLNLTHGVTRKQKIRTFLQEPHSLFRKIKPVNNVHCVRRLKILIYLALQIFFFPHQLTRVCVPFSVSL